MSATFVLKSRYLGQIQWSLRGPCGERGCADPECCCALCRLPIGVSEFDPRWDQHPEHCDDCDVCRDQVPLMMFRGEGKQMEQASFHFACFERAVFVQVGCESEA